MFTKTNVCCQIRTINVRQMERDDEDIGLVELVCEIQPLTPELAGELHDFVRRTLYTASDVEVNSLLSAASFQLGIRPQAVAVRMAPDQKKDSFTLAEAKVDGIKAKRSKKSSAWTLEFRLTCAPASEHQLAQIVDAYLKSRYLSFEPAEVGLFDDAPTASPVSTEDEPELEDADQPAATH